MGDSLRVMATLHVAITYMLPLFGQAMSVTTLSGCWRVMFNSSQTDEHEPA